MEVKRIPESTYDVVIIGGGPGGLTAGIYAARGGLKALLIEGAATASQIMVTDLIENYPGMPEGMNGYDLIERFKKQALQFGLEIRSGDVTAIGKARQGDMDGWEVLTGAGSTFGALAVIVATGAYWRKLGVPGEETFIGKGVSYCATCDGPFCRNREVVVVGGGDTAIQEALFLTNFATKVTVVHRRHRLRASGILQKRAFANKKIEFAWNAAVDEITGGNFVEGVRIRDVGNPDVKREIPAEGVFIFVGLIPNTAIMKGLIDLDENGYIRTDNHMQTSTPGIFACGDCISKRLRQVVTACGDGATAAFSAQLYVDDVKGEAY